MIELDAKELLNLITTRWHRRSTLVILVLLAGAAMLWLFSAINLEEISWPEILTGAIIVAAIVLVWFFSTRLPKAPKGNVGFAVAIVTETKEQREQITKDFVTTLRDLLHRSNLRYRFSFIEFPEYYAQKIETPDDASKYLHSSRCQFMIYGRARTRQIQGEHRHFLNL